MSLKLIHDEFQGAIPSPAGIAKIAGLTPIRSNMCEQLETQGELGDIGAASEIMKKLSASWTKVRRVITEYRAALEIN